MIVYPGDDGKKEGDKKPSTVPEVKPSQLLNNTESVKPQQTKPIQPEQLKRNTMETNQPSNIFDLGRLSNRFNPISRTSEAETIALLTKQANKLIGESGSTPVDVSLLPMSGKNRGMLCSSMIVCLAPKDKVASGVAFHILILGDTVIAPSKLAPQQINVHGVVGPVEVTPVIGDAFDAAYFEACRQTVEDAYQGRVHATKLVSAGAEVVPAGFPFADEEAVRGLLSNAFMACDNVLSDIHGSSFNLNISKHLSGINLLVKQLTNQPHAVGTDRLPVRTDIVLDLVAAKKEKRDAYKPLSMNDLTSEESVFRLGGFLNLMWNPAPGVGAQNQFMPYMTPQMQAAMPQHRYSAQLVMTAVEPGVLSTLRGQLAAFATIGTLSENGAWTRHFRRPVGNELDPRDLGAIGYEVNRENSAVAGARFDTRAATFDDQSMFQLIAAFIRPELTVAFDVPEVGPNSWMTRIWLDAAENDQAAYNQIINSASAMTNGAFDKFFKNGDPVVVAERNRIHNGYYVDSNGKQQDIRNIDLLSVLNLYGDKDPQLARDLSDTYTRVDFSIQQRLAARRKVIDQMTSGGAVYTGYSERILVAPALIQALIAAFRECGVNMIPQTPYHDSSAQMRGAATFLNNFGLSTTSSGLFNPGYANGPVSGYRVFGAGIPGVGY